MAQITSITSEALQAKIRDLLPSQVGFGEDLQAQNVIVPIIDLTETAEGSSVRADLQEALAFGSQTSFNVINTTTTLISNTGFFRVFGTSTARAGSSGTATAKFTLTDGATNTDVYIHTSPAGISSALNYDFVVFLASGESLTATTNTVNSNISGSTRQIADVNGVLTNPSGFNPQ